MENLITSDRTSETGTVVKRSPYVLRATRLWIRTIPPDIGRIKLEEV